MRGYKFFDQDGEHYVTKEEVLRDYYPHWCERMKKIGKADQISEENCLSDYMVTNWAIPTEIVK